MSDRPDDVDELRRAIALSPNGRVSLHEAAATRLLAEIARLRRVEEAAALLLAGVRDYADYAPLDDRHLLEAIAARASAALSPAPAEETP